MEGIEPAAGSWTLVPWALGWEAIRPSGVTVVM